MNKEEIKVGSLVRHEQPILKYLGVGIVVELKCDNMNIDDTCYAIYWTGPSLRIHWWTNSELELIP